MVKGKYIECDFCKKIVYKYPRDIKMGFKNNFCGFKCKSLFSVGKSNSSNTKFKKGLVPWNKGKFVRLNPKGEFKKGQASWNKGIPMSEDTKKKLQKKLKGRKVWNKGKKGVMPTAWNKGLKGFRAGEKSHLWKGGITPIHKQIRSSLEYKLWRKAIFERDNYTCIWCGDNTSGNLEADHIKKFSDYPALRFAIDNGRTLCVSCHRKTDTYGRGKSLLASS